MHAHGFTQVYIVATYWQLNAINTLVYTETLKHVNKQTCVNKSNGFLSAHKVAMHTCMHIPMMGCMDTCNHKGWVSSTNINCVCTSPTHLFYTPLVK